MYYFAYSTNLDTQKMSQQCPGSKPLFKATLPNYKLIFADWSRQLRGGKATIIHFRGDKVLGAVYEVPDICMNRMDKEDPTFSRIKVNVFDEDGEQAEAITYIKSGQPKEDKPSREYLTAIQKGYREWGII